jgi:hypothetical protein
MVPRPFVNAHLFFKPDALFDQASHEAKKDIKRSQRLDLGTFQLIKVGDPIPDKLNKKAELLAERVRYSCLNPTANSERTENFLSVLKALFDRQPSKLRNY